MKTKKGYFCVSVMIIYDKIIQSPLNYTGGKFKLLPQIIPLFPNDINTFVDLFCGGGNVGININSNHVVFNDIDENLIYIFNTLKNLDLDVTFEMINNIIDKYNLSNTYKNGYQVYNCDSSKGLGSYNKDNFLKMRKDFNSLKNKDYYYYILLYTLIVFSFNNQIRFNSKGEFNLPVGKRDFNMKMQSKLSNFIMRLKERDCNFTSIDFRNFDLDTLTENDFVYIDPPYLITCATYNENNAWNEDIEKELLNFIDDLNDRNIRFALSNVLRSKEKQNNILLEWLSTRKYNISQLKYNYSNSNYQTKRKSSKTEEVLITNYSK
jgi:DNA adenine methylase Dam